MLFYLDNWLSVDPEVDMARPTPRGRPARPRRGLNENYARELMELHTLGVDGGYTQKDVTEVARCFTGWTIRNPGQGGGFFFNNALHDNREKVVLGTRIPAGGGIHDGEMVLDMLAHHLSTARFISTKLCRRFVSDDPPRSLVEHCAETFQKTDGDIAKVLEVIFSSPEFFSRNAYPAKVKTPWEFVASALRATGADTTVTPRILGILRNMGQPPYGCQQPNGYADMADARISGGSLLARMNFAGLLVSGRIPGIRPEPLAPAAGADPQDDAAARVARLILNDIPDPSIVASIRERIKTGDIPDAPAGLAALIIGSPEFQRK